MTSIPRTKTSQPDLSFTRKSTKRYNIQDPVDANQLNIELDHIHDRINELVVEDANIEDLSTAATLADVIERLNLVTGLLIRAGLIRP